MQDDQRIKINVEIVLVSSSSRIKEGVIICVPLHANIWAAVLCIWFQNSALCGLITPGIDAKKKTVYHQKYETSDVQIAINVHMDRVLLLTIS